MKVATVAPRLLCTVVLAPAMAIACTTSPTAVQARRPARASCGLQIHPIGAKDGLSVTAVVDTCSGLIHTHVHTDHWFARVKACIQRSALPPVCVTTARWWPHDVDSPSLGYVPGQVIAYGSYPGATWIAESI